jgi:hypothetical protein
VTLSKFSVNTTGREQGGEHEGAGTGGAESLIRSQLSRPVEGDLAARWAMAREEPIAATTMQAVMSNREQTSGRNRDGVNVRLGCVVIQLAISVV